MKIAFYCMLLVVSFLTSSCVFTEELHIHNNGSGTYSFKTDMSKMMESMSEMSPKDSLEAPEKIDTLIYFKDILKEHQDSIRQLSVEDQEILNALEDFTIHMQVDEETHQMRMDFDLDFEDLSELKNMEEKISKIQSLNEKKNEEEKIPSKADVSYEFNGATFKRIVTLKKLTQEEEAAIDKSLEQSASLMEGSLYRVVYHFDQKIKHVSSSHAAISKDGTTLTIEIPMDTLVKNPKLLDFEVKLD